MPEIADITIKETAPTHLHEMATAMSADSAQVALNFGLTPKKALWHSYRKSIICKSAFVNGKLAAIFGISGNIFGETGRPWLIMTPEVNEHPMRVAFIYRRILKDFQKMFPVLEDYVPEENESAIRLMELMGFKVSKNTVTMGNSVFRRAEKRNGI